MFSVDTIFSNATRCTLQGNGDPNVNSVTPVSGCTEAIYLNDLPDTRNTNARTVWIWNAATSTWVARA